MDAAIASRFGPQWYDVTPEGALQLSVSVDEQCLSPVAFAAELAAGGSTAVVADRVPRDCIESAPLARGKRS